MVRRGEVGSRGSPEVPASHSSCFIGSLAIEGPKRGYYQRGNCMGAILGLGQIRHSERATGQSGEWFETAMDFIPMGAERFA